MPDDLARTAGLRHALEILNKDIVPDEYLLAIGQEAEACTLEFLARQELISSFLKGRPIDIVIEVTVWVFGTAGFLAALIDFAETGELSGWGMFSLAAGQIGLFLSAWMYDRKRREHNYYATELEEIRETMDLLDTIMNRVNAHL
jgi:hypothetical protein